MWFNGKFIRTIYNKFLSLLTDIGIVIITTAIPNNMRWNSLEKISICRYDIGDIFWVKSSAIFKKTIVVSNFFHLIIVVILLIYSSKLLHPLYGFIPTYLYISISGHIYDSTKPKNKCI